MSFIKIEDEHGNDMILGLKRISKVKLDVPEAAENDESTLTILTLEPLSKDDVEEIVMSRTPVDEIWEQIKMRM